MHYKQEPIRQAGFLTRRPTVASVDFPLPDYDPSTLVPLVYTAAGKRVGCRVLWAELGEPMVLQFDYFSRESQYYVYLVERSRNPPSLPWEPKAGVVLESRLAKTYDPAIQTVAGFRKLWMPTTCSLPPTFRKSGWQAVGRVERSENRPQSKRGAGRYTLGRENWQGAASAQGESARMDPAATKG